MKKKILKWGLALAALVAIVGFIGCPTDADDDSSSSKKQTGARLEWLTIGTVTEVYPNEPSNNEAAALGNSSENEIELTSSQKTADIRYELQSTSNKARIEFALASGNDVGAYSADKGNRTYADGDKLLAKITSEDGKATNFYAFYISIGKNARLESVTIGATPQAGDTYLGKPGADFAAVEQGNFQLDLSFFTSPSAAKLIVLAQDEDAVVSYKLDNGTPTAIPTTGFSVINRSGILLSTFNLDHTVNDYYLYIEVVPTSETGITLYYIMHLTFPKTTPISYGVPKLVDESNPGAPFYIDPIWDSVDELDIDRVNKAESYEPYFATVAGQHTTAKAKALWDDGGIWVLVDVDVKEFNDGSTTKPRPITPANEHNGDSVEIFLNERLQILDAVKSASDTSDIGGQFRVGVLNDRSGREAQAVAANTDKGVVADAVSNLEPFNGATYAKTRTVLKDSNGDYVGSLSEATNGGYKLIAYIPFKFSSSGNANAVFESGNVKDGAAIGFELQLNVNSGKGRDGILTWNGINTQAYGNSSGYGIAILNRDNATPDTKVFPEITEQKLTSASYAVDATNVTALSVTTTATDIKWFRSDTQFGVGTQVGTGASYTPPVDISFDGSTNYYYAVVTANNVAVVTSTRARIKVGEPPVPRIEPFAEKITVTGAATAAVYGFDIGEDTLADYEKITVKIKLDALSSGTNGRLRAWGNFNPGASTWGNPTGIQNAVTTKLLNENDAATFTQSFVEYDIAFTTAAYTSQGTDTGLLVIAIGPAGPPGSSASLTYYLTDIQLVKKVSGDKVPAMHPASLPLSDLGIGLDAYANNAGTDTFTRELIPFEEKIVASGEVPVPVYAFDIGDDQFSDYEKITVSLKLDASSTGSTGRLRAWGSHTPTSTWANPTNAANAVGTKLLNENAAATYTANWVDYDIEFTTGAYSSQSSEKGLLVIAVGPCNPSYGNNVDLIYYLADIKLEKANGDFVRAIHPASSILSDLGIGTNAYVNQAGADAVTRGPIDWYFKEVVDTRPDGPPLATTPFVVDLTSNPVKNDTAWDTQYNNGFAIDLTNAGGDLDVTAATYGKITVIAKFYDSDETELAGAPPYGNLQFKLLQKGATNANATNVTQISNFGASGTTNSGPEGGIIWTGTVPTSNPAYKTAANPVFGAIGIQTSKVPASGDAAYVEVLSITLTGN